MNIFMHENFPIHGTPYIHTKSMATSITYHSLSYNKTLYNNHIEASTLTSAFIRYKVFINKISKVIQFYH